MIWAFRLQPRLRLPRNSGPAAQAGNLIRNAQASGSQGPLRLGRGGGPSPSLSGLPVPVSYFTGTLTGTAALQGHCAVGPGAQGRPGRSDVGQGHEPSRAAWTFHVTNRSMMSPQLRFTMLTFATKKLLRHHQEALASLVQMDKRSFLLLPKVVRVVLILQSPMIIQLTVWLSLATVT